MSATPVCPKCGKEMPSVCPVPGCGKPTEVYSRIVGYLRPIRTWNDGKQQEYRERVPFILRKMEEHQKSE